MRVWAWVRVRARARVRVRVRVRVMRFAPLGEDGAREHGRGRRAWVGLVLGC